MDLLGKVRNTYSKAVTVLCASHLQALTCDHPWQLLMVVCTCSLGELNDQLPTSQAKQPSNHGQSFFTSRASLSLDRRQRC